MNSQPACRLKNSCSVACSTAWLDWGPFPAAAAVASICSRGASLRFVLNLGAIPLPPPGAGVRLSPASLLTKLNELGGQNGGRAGGRVPLFFPR